MFSERKVSWSLFLGRLAYFNEKISKGKIMAIYIFIVTVFYLLSLSRIKHTKIVFWCLMGILVLISVCRYEVGTDYNHFSYVFDRFIKGNGVYTEFGYKSYMWFINKMFHDNSIALYAGEAIFTILCFGYFIVKNVNKKYWIYAGSLFITTTIYFATMNATRQYVAIGFLLLAFEQMKQKKYVKMTILFIISITFHASSVAVLVYFGGILWVNWKQRDEQRLRVLHILVIVSICLMFVDLRNIFQIISIVLEKISFLKRFVKYFESIFFTRQNETAIMKFIIPDLFWLYLYYNYKKLKNENKNISYFMVMYALYLIINNCFYGINIFIRLGWYFEFSLLILIPLGVEMIENYKKRFFIKMMFMIYYLALTSYSIFYKGGHGVVPYKSIFTI